MSSDLIFKLSDPRADLSTTGGKGASLARLSAAGLPVPDGFHITTAAYRRFIDNNNLQERILQAAAGADLTRPSSFETASLAVQALFNAAALPEDIQTAIAGAYQSLAEAFGENGSHLAVAVRSSATAEDLPELSFAGQQETFLNIQGFDALLDAVRRCWASLWTARAISYRLQHGIDHDDVALAVVVQALIPAESAGILFTANPISGRRDEIFINAAWGLGEAIVGGKVTPDTILVDKSTGAVKERQTASKTVMTVRTRSGVAEQPVDAARRTMPALDDHGAAELVGLAVKIESLYGQPQDIEWCLAGGKFYIVQSRPITALPEEKITLPPVPAKWNLPKGAYAAMRNNIVELMADPLTPLFGSLGRSVINQRMQIILERFFGRKGVMPAEIIILVNGYAYMNGSVSPGEAVKLTFTSASIMKRMFRGAVERWTEEGRPAYLSALAGWQAQPWIDLPVAELLELSRHVFAAAIDAYLALVSGVIPAAWVSEAFFTRIYNLLIKRRGDPPAAAFLLGFDSTPIQAEKSLYRLAQWAGSYPQLAGYLRKTSASQLGEALLSGADHGIEPMVWEEWRQRFSQHIGQFGHTIYNLDFSNPVPADDPAPLFETIKMYLNGLGVDPESRQQAIVDQRQQAIEAIEMRLGKWRLGVFRKHLQRAQKYAPLREDGLADVSLGYPLLRRMLLEIGRRFCQAGMFKKPDEIFWLTGAEAEDAAAALTVGGKLPPADRLFSERQALWQAQSSVVPPLMLPNLKPARRAGRSKNSLKGVAASPGSVTAIARVLHGPEDFNQMQPGDVLVASITTPAWTPLFAMASAVVTDVGGPLSHGSIVAREYGIPAVLGTESATRRLHSGQLITVDGTRGEVILNPPRPAGLVTSGPQSTAFVPPHPKGLYMRGGLVELLPDSMSTLFETLGMPAAVAGAYYIGELISHRKPVLPDDYYTSINTYAYMSASIPASSYWWMLTALLPAYPRLLREAVPLWRDTILPEYQAVVERLSGLEPGRLSAAEMWQASLELMQAAGNYFATLLYATMGASAGSEALLTGIYNKLVRRPDDPPASTLVMGFNSIPVRAEKSLYDLAQLCQKDSSIQDYLLATPSVQLVPMLLDRTIPAGVTESTWLAFCDGMEQHLCRFGHIVYDLDFARPLPLDQPAPMIETIKMYLRGLGVNPYARQQASEARRIETSRAVLARLRGLRRWAFRSALNWAQSLGSVREDALADLGLGYPLLRRLFFELGSRLAVAGALESPEQIYWLTREEIETCLVPLDRNENLASLRDRVTARLSHYHRMTAVTPPPTVPERKRFLGMKMDLFVPAAASDQVGSSLKGIGASSGVVTAPARVLHGPEDFDQMQPGEVLVAAITTPAWTPLFAMASAVVTDMGGPLSHGSIVAREYGIPAVMGTGVASRRIRSGQVITVDGSRGLVELNGHNRLE